jgi:hypothetical protein
MHAATGNTLTQSPSKSVFQLLGPCQNVDGHSLCVIITTVTRTAAITGTLILVLIFIGTAVRPRMWWSNSPPGNQQQNVAPSSTQVDEPATALTPKASVIPPSLPEDRLSVFPLSGKAPLTVTTRFDGCDPELDWGDGTPHWLTTYGMQTCPSDTGTTTIRYPVIVRHTYSMSGTYLINLDDKVYTSPITISVTGDNE